MKQARTAATIFAILFLILAAASDVIQASSLRLAVSSLAVVAFVAMLTCLVTALLTAMSRWAEDL